MIEKRPISCPSKRLGWILLLYRLLWIAGLPLAILYFLLRSRRDHRYTRHLDERFGYGPTLQGAVWIHAVSLGEIRSAVPIIRDLLDEGEKVLVTCLTPAGRQEGKTVFRAELERGRIVIRYLPLEFGFAFRRFLQACKPKYGLILEFDIWPVMIMSAKQWDIPLYLCNTQITTRNLRARGPAAARLVFLKAVSGAFAKSERHGERLCALGTPNVHVTGEFRFDQPVPDAMRRAAESFVREHGLRIPGRPVIALASVVKGEDGRYVEMIKATQASCSAAGRQRPLFVYVPRAPERFSEVAATLARAGQSVSRRSQILDADLAAPATQELDDVDILLGDSLGEMQFYIALGDIVIVGGGFLDTGAHNVIEPIIQQKPVFVGPHIWTIEFPASEAISAGVLFKVATPAELAAKVEGLIGAPERIAEIAKKAAAFRKFHAGSTSRTLSAIAGLQKSPTD